ncbi:hypothetical protein D3C73_1372620 [compost metagenome]
MRRPRQKIVLQFVCLQQLLRQIFDFTKSVREPKRHQQSQHQKNKKRLERRKRIDRLAEVDVHVLLQRQYVQGDCRKDQISASLGFVERRQYEYVGYIQQRKRDIKRRQLPEQH